MLSGINVTAMHHMLVHIPQISCEASCLEMRSICRDRQQQHLRLSLCREVMTTKRSITELEESDLLQYFSVDPQALPEAFPEHSSLAALDMLPKSGCKGLQVEEADSHPPGSCHAVDMSIFLQPLYP